MTTIIIHRKLTFRSVSATPVDIPMKRTLGTSPQKIVNATLL